MAHPPKIEKIHKRDGRLVEFDQGKITNAIYKAAIAVGGKTGTLLKGFRTR